MIDIFFSVTSIYLYLFLISVDNIQRIKSIDTDYIDWFLMSISID